MGSLEKRGLVTAGDSIAYAARATSEATAPLTLEQLLASDQLTEAQKDVPGQIEAARLESDSYIGFSNRLVAINNEIYDLVPLKEQELLFAVTSTMYYGLEAANELVRKGLLSGAPEGDITLAQLKLGFQSAFAYGESGGSSWWNDWGSCAFAIGGSVFATAAAVTVAAGTGGAGAALGFWIGGKIIATVGVIGSCT